MLDAMKFSTLALPALSPLAAALVLGFGQPALGQSAAQNLWLPSSNERAIVLGILAAEFSLQNGDSAGAASAYYEVAKRSLDAKVAERAVELLMRNRRLDDAKEIVALWRQADAAGARSHQIALALALSTQDEPSALSAVKSLAALAAPADAVMDAARQLAQHRDRDFAVKLASVFVDQLPALAESQYALSVASTGVNNARIGEAMIAIDRALAIKANWPQAVAVKSRLLLARALAAKTPLVDAGAEAQALLEAAVIASPDVRELRVLLARTLFDLEKFAASRKRFVELAEDGKEDAEDMRLAATLSSFQGQDWEVAEREFQGALASERGDPAAVLYYLGRISEGKKRWAEAVERFLRVPPSERYWESQLRIAGALSQDKRLLQAMAHLRALKPANSAQRLLLAQTESTLWREAGDHHKAFAALDAALSSEPDNPDLLYDTAMLAERIDKLDEAEKRLRRVIALQPDRAHAHNALGYSFADRNVNLAEARSLIEKAHSLAPEDPAILDSMGWIAFRQGRLPDAERYLRRALENFADGEVAAHLGEVLWAQGRKDDARAVWQSQLKVQPDSDVLKKTMARFE
jgi:Flp pilus assembly protein TadD